MLIHLQKFFQKYIQRKFSSTPFLPQFPYQHFFKETKISIQKRRTQHLGSFKRYVRWGGEGGVIEKRTKTNRGRGSEHVCTVAFLNKMPRFLKWSFIVTLGNEQGRTRGEGGEGEVIKTRESCVNVLFECPLLVIFTGNQENNYLVYVVDVSDVLHLCSKYFWEETF